MKALRTQFTYANLMSTLAVVLVLGGGVAYAADTVFSSDIVNDEVFSADVRDDTLAGGGLGAVDLQNNSVRTAEILDGTVSGSDILNSSVVSADVTDNSLTGNDINEGSLGIVPNANTLDGLDSARFKNTAKDGIGSCNNIVNPTICSSATLSGLRTGATGDDVYLIATWRWYGNGTGADGALCRIAQGVADSGFEAAQFGQSGNEHNGNAVAAIGTMVAIDTAPPTSSMTYSLVCDQIDGSVHIPISKIAAVRLSG
jgi:hypothetical protein